MEVIEYLIEYFIISKIMDSIIKTYQVVRTIEIKKDKQVVHVTIDGKIKVDLLTKDVNKYCQLKYKDHRYVSKSYFKGKLKGVSVPVLPCNNPLDEGSSFCKECAQTKVPCFNDKIVGLDELTLQRGLIDHKCDGFISPTKGDSPFCNFCDNCVRRGFYPNRLSTEYSKIWIRKIDGSRDIAKFSFTD